MPTNVDAHGEEADLATDCQTSLRSTHGSLPRGSSTSDMCDKLKANGQVRVRGIRHPVCWKEWRWRTALAAAGKAAGATAFKENGITTRNSSWPGCVLGVSIQAVKDDTMW